MSAAIQAILWDLDDTLLNTLPARMASLAHAYSVTVGGVIDTHDFGYADGMQRLAEVTKAAQGLAITSNGLLPVLAVRDRTGICHQLANEDKLRWCHAASE